MPKSQFLRLSRVSSFPKLIMSGKYIMKIHKHLEKLIMKKYLFFLLSSCSYFTALSNGITIDSVKFVNNGNIIKCRIYETHNYGVFYRRRMAKVENDSLKFYFFIQQYQKTPQSLINISDSNSFNNFSGINLCAYIAYTSADTNTVDTTLYPISVTFNIDSFIESTNLCAPLNLASNRVVSLNYNSFLKTIYTKSSATISVYNQQGQLVTAKQCKNGSFPLPNNLASGLYFVVSESKLGRERLKIFVR
jgi:hypothetical protein